MMLGTDDPLTQGIPMRENCEQFFWATVEPDEDSALNRLSELVSEDVVGKDIKKVQKGRGYTLAGPNQKFNRQN